MISIRHGWQDNKKQNCRLLNQYSSERTARVQIKADSNCILLFFQSLKATFQKQKTLPRVRHNMRNRRLSWTRASKTGKRARKTRGEAQTSFMRGRREFGGVRNVCDVCGTHNIGGVRGMSDIRCVCRLSTRCTIRNNRTGCATCRLLFFRRWPLLYVT